MDYTDIPRRLTLPERQRSLFNIIPAAQMAAHESSATIYVIHSPFYVDGNVDSEHVYATREASAIIYPKRNGIDWAINAAVEPDGTVFFPVIEDALLVLEQTSPELRKIKLELCEQNELPLS